MFFVQTVSRSKNFDLIYLVSHHGAETNDSTTNDLLKVLKPMVSIISAPINSRHGHPAHSTIQLLTSHTTVNLERYHFIKTNVPAQNISIKQNRLDLFPFSFYITRKKEKNKEKEFFGDMCLT